MGDPADILVVDDEEATRVSIARTLEPSGFRVRSVASAEEASAVLARESSDLILCDIRLPAMDGLEFQSRVRADFPDVPVVMITAYGAVESAIRALKQGAYDYLVKPFSSEELRGAVRRALESRSLRLENATLREVVREIQGDAWLGETASMKRLYAEAARVAASNAAVFIDGESGTGKEILARTIHAQSPRRERIFVALNCAAVPEGLADSQLFGHVRGAFTGAVVDQRGFLEIADGGTLFLDEVAELKSEIQAKLLRVLEDGRLRRVGSDREMVVDVRILTAAQKPPEPLVREGKLREDLFFRIGAIHLHVPPLRERREDVRGLALHFLRRFSRDLKKPIEGITPEAIAILENYDWPGNVRELKNAMERASIFAAPGGTVDIPEIPGKVREAAGSALFTIAGPSPTLDQVTRAYIDHVVAQCGGNQAQAARILAIAPSTIWRNRPRGTPH
ncbi:MAG: sigma-54-dependent Fis family transcriptional regulator [Planctomycetes bacterium]|nr:sigma-54-dependent Fis family transcriptional regulator [Planctomycetota bacterium]